jgi:outer membrane protein
VTKNILLVVNLVLVLALGAFVFFRQSSVKNGFVLNQRVFEEFAGKGDLEKQLTDLQNSQRSKLDSLRQLAVENPKLLEQYDQLATTFQLREQELSQQYTSDIWKRINEYVSDYGKEHGYSFIFGASGNGNLMYAGEANDVTDQVIVYINDRYKTGK